MLQIDTLAINFIIQSAFILLKDRPFFRVPTILHKDRLIYFLLGCLNGPDGELYSNFEN
jgi:hypothetical protein